MEDARYQRAGDETERSATTTTGPFRDGSDAAHAPRPTFGESNVLETEPKPAGMDIGDLARLLHVPFVVECIRPSEMPGRYLISVTSADGGAVSSDDAENLAEQFHKVDELTKEGVVRKLTSEVAHSALHGDYLCTLRFESPPERTPTILSILQEALKGQSPVIQSYQYQSSSRDRPLGCLYVELSW
jgi:hypothetical protein